ncbi:hypothetical protein ACI65C_013792 [Semiaphis heraclei]
MTTNLIIRYGFQNIKPHFNFTNDKGKKLYESNHVFNVEELRLVEGLSFITGFVLDGSRNITHAFCQCPAGVGSKCKHVAALIIFINNEEGVSKTNEPQIWGEPSKYGENLYKKGKQISALFPQKRLKLEVPPVSFKRSN